MELVLDANILFAALIKDSKTTELLLDPRVKLYLPEFALQEFAKYEKELLQKTNRTKEEFEEILAIIKKIVRIVPKEEFRNKIREAAKICPDRGDIDYFALALKLNIPIWSNDKGFKQQTKAQVFTTSQLLDKL